ncbi:MAG TPA: SusC/RagA family TonB-linked outer membrane protein [Gelidibacter sp.]|uniref:SusC/RagA family TonB-linked outer membrane protein n=1 Tax=Gelidibacter sp. TaxID=2018083 RepID=UPI002C6764E0|nr:SusC/RagA family TonB-linked outer membrane protein [Gelidibacter sp.]HXJ98269.1 SusC/RagA family TonB-linked outer membrane protein [Gelidibacter sp.]
MKINFHHRRYLCLAVGLLLYLINYGNAFAQNTITLKGIVKDSEAPLSGVTVREKDTNNGTMTDENGKYSLQIRPGSIVVFSFIGYKTQTHIINETTLSITLQPDQAVLDEVVINAGYYNVKDRERTGSIVRVTAKDIEFQPVINPLQAIQGRMAGVSITQNTGVPGGGFDIKIRGRNSLSANYTGRNNPLYIVNGIPLNEMPASESSGYSISLFNSSISVLNAINPNDIESIEILKDADATAIYGSRGANGVVLITTKKGKTGETNFTISSSTAFSKVGRFMKMMNTEQFNQMRNEAFANDGITAYPINAYDMTGAWDKNRYTNWQKELIGETAIDNTISLGVSGGNEFTRFNVNTSHNESTTVFPTDKGYKRNSALISFSHQSEDNRLQLGVSTAYSTQNNNLPSADLTKKSLELPPNAPALYNEDGTLNWQDGTFQNPLAQLNKTYENNTKALVLNLDLSYNLFSNTYLKLNGGIATNNFTEKVLTPHTIYNPSLGYTSERSQSQKSNFETLSYIIEPQIHWRKKWNKHSFDVLTGATFQTIDNQKLIIAGVGFSSNALISNISAANNKVVSQVGNSQYKYAALFARLNYIFNDRYILNLTGRRDGSSRFGPDNRFGNFGAVGTAWLLTEESFLKNTSWLSFGKLRASYGTTGSDNVGDYAYLDTYTINNQMYDGETGLYPSRLYNPNYSWEKTTKLEVALELGLFNNRINTDISYYKNRSSNQLIGLTLPSTTGFESITDNFPATVENTGWEFTLNTMNFRNNSWQWVTNFNISFPKNKLIAFPDIENSTYRNTYIIGKSINLVKLYHYEGIDLETGMYKITDYNRDGNLSRDDKQIAKEIGIQYHGGLQNTITYKSFSLDFLFQFVKQTNYNFHANYRYIGELSFNLPVEMWDRWTIDNTKADYTFASSGGNFDLQMLYNYMTQTDRVISDASFIRLKNVALSYKLQISKAKIDSLVLYVQGQNLWTITNYFGMDPESVFPGNLPPLRTYAFGVQLTF